MLEDCTVMFSAGEDISSELIRVVAGNKRHKGRTFERCALAALALAEQKDLDCLLLAVAPLALAQHLVNVVAALLGL